MHHQLSWTRDSILSKRIAASIGSRRRSLLSTLRSSSWSASRKVLQQGLKKSAACSSSFSFSSPTSKEESTNTRRPCLHHGRDSSIAGYLAGYVDPPTAPTHFYAICPTPPRPSLRHAADVAGRDFMSVFFDDRHLLRSIYCIHCKGGYSRWPPALAHFAGNKVFKSIITSS